jgi:60 kDa SS-A/Ro ribonucleoprotein
MSEMQVNQDFGYTIKNIDFVLRLLILGSRVNQYHQKKNNSLSKDDIEFIKQCIKDGEGPAILKLVEEIYETGRAPKQDITLQIHAILCRAENDELRKSALGLLSRYRTISHIYNWKKFHSSCENPTLGKITKGFGRGPKRSLNEWFLKMKERPIDLAHQITKYGSREGWSFEQLIKCSHLTTGTGDDRVVNKSNSKKEVLPATSFDLVLRYAVMGIEEANKMADKFYLKETDVYKYLSAVHEAKHCLEVNKQRLVDLIYGNKLCREQVPTWSLKDSDVLTALLVNQEKTRIVMPLTALLRNLGNMSTNNVLDDNHIRTLLCSHLLNKELIIKSRIHPVSVLTAWFTYKSGSGLRGDNTWYPQPDILKALEEMFYLSFQNVEPTGKRICFLIDCSGSMGSPSLCESVTNAEAAALLAMIFARSETKALEAPQHSFYLFTSCDSNNWSGRGRTGLTDVSDVIHAEAPLNDVLKAVQRSDWGTTDISMGILEAMKYKRKYDAFVVITDNDVNSGIKPVEAMKQYRTAMKMPNVKLAVVATQGTDFTIADPEDPDMMDFVGFDSHGPKLLQDFIRS